MMYGYIYKTTNLVNNKIYVGQKKSTIFLQDYKGSGKKIQAAFLKYGFDNFKVELLERCYSKDELNKQEIFWISKLDARNEATGYNIALGGDVGGFNKGSKLTDLHKRHISEGLTGRQVSNETRKKISETEKGKIVSEETKKKISIATKAAMQNPEVKEKCRKGALTVKRKKRRPLTDEQKLRISIGTKLGMAKAKAKKSTGK